MTWANSETQKSLYKTLIESEELLALLNYIPAVDGPNPKPADYKIYDYVPQKSVYPYVVIGFNPQTDRGSHTTEGWDSPLLINVWARDPNRGKKQVQAIQAVIDKLLHKADICIEGWNIINLRRDTCNVIPEPDSVTYQGIQTFNLLLGEASYG